MYVLQTKPDDQCLLSNNEAVNPLATLKDEHGGVSHITKDDGCIVLANNTGRYRGGSNEESVELFSWATHWYPEALAALRTLTDDELI